MKQQLFAACVPLVGCTFLQSCGDFADSKLVVVNNSNRSVYITHSEQQVNKGWLPDAPPYPVDELGNRAHISRRSDSLYERKLWPHTSGRLSVVGEYWEDFLKRDSVTFFILDAAVVDSLSWPEIQNENLYAKKFYLPVDSARKLNWRITFN